ncbi:hypothetical protein CSAL01_10781 [Colletotrichum salicis]|uniref:Uncharacterized protein n=1 Tax=Colletotrichum salicis TaxID=1209931 RepID=A0A135T6F6_9PEZI|nr:hypothetical protein CSAL01_10781 [Colletotrichum salicis]
MDTRISSLPAGAVGFPPPCITSLRPSADRSSLAKTSFGHLQLKQIAAFAWRYSPQVNHAFNVVPRPVASPCGPSTSPRLGVARISTFGWDAPSAASFSILGFFEPPDPPASNTKPAVAVSRSRVFGSTSLAGRRFMHRNLMIGCCSGHIRNTHQNFACELAQGKNLFKLGRLGPEKYAFGADRRFDLIFASVLRVYTTTPMSMAEKTRFAAYLSTQTILHINTSSMHPSIARFARLVPPRRTMIPIYSHSRIQDPHRYPYTSPFVAKVDQEALNEAVKNFVRLRKVEELQKANGESRELTEKLNIQLQLYLQRAERRSFWGLFF